MHLNPQTIGLHVLKKSNVTSGMLHQNQKVSGILKSTTSHISVNTNTGVRSHETYQISIWTMRGDKNGHSR
eukprot:scaffold12507_cov34-Cyclotella_meneghiniana.AAC.1